MFESRSASNSTPSSLSPSPSITRKVRLRAGLESDQDSSSAAGGGDGHLSPGPLISRCSIGHVDQIKNQLLMNGTSTTSTSSRSSTPHDLSLLPTISHPHPQLVDDQNHQNGSCHSKPVLKKFDDDHLNRLSQSILNTSLSSVDQPTVIPPSSSSQNSIPTPNPDLIKSNDDHHQHHPNSNISPTLSSLQNDFANLSLHSLSQFDHQSSPPPPDRSDSDSTSTSHHQPSICAPSADDPPPSNQPASLFLDHEHPPPLLNDHQQPITSPTQPTPIRSSQEEGGPDDISTLALSARITEVAMSVQDVALALFQVQELRHSSPSNNPDFDRSSSSQTSPSIMASDRPSGSALTQVDKALMRLEKKVETTALEIANLETLMRPYRTTDGSKLESAKFINVKFDTILEDWERIQHDSEVLKDELKEDKWLVVFRAVSGQAEEMMKSLEKVLALSQEFIHQVHKRIRQSDSSPSRRRSLNTSHLDRSKSSRKRESNGSSTFSWDKNEVEELINSYNSLLKNFHAKNKHYVPSCERVLGILSKGINSRSTKNGEVLRRYADMNLRFTNIQESITKAGLELTAIEQLLQQALGMSSTPAEPSTPPSRLQLPLPSNLAMTPSTAGNKDPKSLLLVPNHLQSPSPPLASRSPNRASLSVSSFKRLASKLTYSATPSISSQPSSVCSGQTPSNDPSTLNANSRLGRATAPNGQRQLRSIRSTLNMGYSSISRFAKSTSKLETVTPLTHEEKRAPSVVPEQRLRGTASRQATHRHTASQEKPRWNISLKRVEDTPTGSIDPSNSRRLNQLVQRSQSRAGLRPSTPSAALMSHHQYYPRPPSAAGRSEISCTTNLSMSVYRPRPPSRQSRIPAPLWDPNMDSQRTRSKGSIDLQELIRPNSRCAGPPPSTNKHHHRLSNSPSTTSVGLISPSESDVAKMPGVIVEPGRSTSRAQRRISVGSVSGKQLAGVGPELESLIAELESEQPNPADPLDMLIHEKCREQMSKVLLRRIDSPLSRNPEKAKLAGAGIGDQARYCFWFIGIGRPTEEKSVMCKLVESKRIVLNKSSSSPSLAGLQHPELKVLVRTKLGWRDLEIYLLDCQQ